MHAVILAGGKGTRLAPYTTVLPKPLMPVQGMPILEVILRQLASHGFSEITLCVGYLAQLIEAYFGDGRQLGVHISYSYEDKPLGTAGPLGLVTPSDEPVLVMNADILSTLNYADMFRYHIAREADLTVGLYPKQVKIDMGVLKTNGGNEVVDYVEKPEFEYQVSMGIYIVGPAAHRSVLADQRLDLPELVTGLVGQGRRVVGYLFNGYWLDIGRPADFEKACEEFERLRPLFLPDATPPKLPQAAPPKVLQNLTVGGISPWPTNGHNGHLDTTATH